MTAIADPITAKIKMREMMIRDALALRARRVLRGMNIALDGAGFSGTWLGGARRGGIEGRVASAGGARRGGIEFCATGFFKGNGEFSPAFGAEFCIIR